MLWNPSFLQKYHKTSELMGLDSKRMLYKDQKSTALCLNTTIDSQKMLLGWFFLYNPMQLLSTWLKVLISENYMDRYQCVGWSTKSQKTIAWESKTEVLFFSFPHPLPQFNVATFLILWGWFAKKSMFWLFKSASRQKSSISFGALIPRNWTRFLLVSLGKRQMFWDSGEKDPLMTYGTALITQSQGQEIPDLD